MAAVFLYPERYRTTGVSETFETHHLLEHSRHRLGQALRELGHPYEHDIYNPCTDIRETIKHYYIEVELPGAVTEDFSLKWTNPRTLLLQAEVKRPEIKEDSASVAPGAEMQQDAAASKSKDTHEAIHILSPERRIGTFARAFHFNVEVDQENVEAKLQRGLLRIVVPKHESGRKEAKHVKVENTES